MGALMAPFTETAAANPHAWFPTARSAEELVTPTPVNRMVFFPYAKYLDAVMATEQAAGALRVAADLRVVPGQELADRRARARRVPPARTRSGTRAGREIGWRPRPPSRRRR